MIKALIKNHLACALHVRDLHGMGIFHVLNGFVQVIWCHVLINVFGDFFQQILLHVGMPREFVEGPRESLSSCITTCKVNDET